MFTYRTGRQYRVRTWHCPYRHRKPCSTIACLATLCLGFLRCLAEHTGLLPLSGCHGRQNYNKFTALLNIFHIFNMGHVHVPLHYIFVNKNKSK